MEHRKFANRRDFIVIAAALAVAAAVWGWYAWRSAANRSAGSQYQAEVTTLDGYSQTISLDKDAVYTIEARLTVTLEVRDGAIRFENSLCPDHLCEGFGWIDEEGEYAICMPAGVYVNIRKK